MNPVVHFEFPVEDHARASKFYAEAFGWEAHQMGPEMGNYTVVHTSETDDNNMIKEPGRINGGFFTKSPDNTVPGVVISVDDIEEAKKKVIAAGGTIVGASKGPDSIDDIPGIGKYVSIRDTEGNRVALLQPNPQM